MYFDKEFITTHIGPLTFEIEGLEVRVKLDDRFSRDYSICDQLWLAQELLRLVECHSHRSFVLQGWAVDPERHSILGTVISVITKSSPEQKGDTEYVSYLKDLECEWCVHEVRDGGLTTRREVAVT